MARIVGEIIIGGPAEGDAQSSARLSRIGRPRPRELLGGAIGPAILAPTHAVTQMTAP
jgi:hypothetical protein